MSRLRVSHTFLLLWSQGRINEALDAYYHRQTEKSIAMEDGIRLHKQWENDIQTKGTAQFGATTLKFKDPRCEVKHIVQYNDHIDLSGTFDCIDSGDIYEFKSGVMSSMEYAGGYQLGIYFLMGEHLSLGIKRGILVHFNQHTGETDISIVWNTEREREKAKNFIDSLSGEIVTYFEQYNLPFDKALDNRI